MSTIVNPASMFRANYSRTNLQLITMAVYLPRIKKNMAHWMEKSYK
jgi:hypothetical protein